VTLIRVSEATIKLVGRLPAAIIEWLAKVPTTNLRICATILCVLATAGRVVVSAAWTPSLEWLAFLAAMAGLDSMHFMGKRMTQSEYVAAKQGNGHATPGPQ
jgi:hypothetical protein